MGNKQLVQHPECPHCHGTKTIRITRRSLWCDICRGIQKVPESEQFKTEGKDALPGEHDVRTS
jgi:ribosomal protein L37AE/L43A